VWFSGVDIVDGTPVLDIKPYIPEYDCPVELVHNSTEGISMCETIDVANEKELTEKTFSEQLRDRTNNSSSQLSPVKEQCVDLSNNCVQSADWIDECRVNKSVLSVEFTPRALRELDKFSPDITSEYGLKLFQSNREARQAIVDVLLADPRSAYRRQSCVDRLYYFTIDSIHVTCWFDGTLAEVLKVQPVLANNTLQSALYDNNL